VDTLRFKTQSANKETVQRNWYVVDATGQTLGRMCSQIAHVLRGKNKPYYTPHVDCGDYVIVLNAGKVEVTGNKWEDNQHIWHTGYPGGQRTLKFSEVRSKHPERLIEHSVKGMLPKNRLGRAMYKKLFVYAGDEHPHIAQKPQPLNINK
jgi:large subunit ribosomal protein L13